MTLDMASIAPQDILAAMQNSSNTRQTAPALQDKIIHAHTASRISWIEDAPRDDESSSTDIENDAESVKDGIEERERAVKTQAWWDAAIQKFMGMNGGYENAAVLLVRWHDELDDLNTRKETEELHKLFAEQFNYQCTTVELDVLTKPQLQMNKHLSTFLEKHDGPNNLLIVYYTGHGLHKEGKYLELTARMRPISPTHHKKSKNGLAVEARLNWERAEALLHTEDVEGDVLTILDTCYASNGQKSGKEDTRTHELLSACGYDDVTASPGPESFTRALIDGLKDLLAEHRTRGFTTFTLQQKINKNPTRRATQSHLWEQIFHHGRHIRLAPLKSKIDDADADEQGSALANLPRSYVTLRFGLRKQLDQAGIEYLANRMAKAFSNPGLVGLMKIDWLGMRDARAHPFGRAALAVRYFRRWRKNMREIPREKRWLLKMKPKPIKVPAMEAVVERAMQSPTKRKRTHDEHEDEEAVLRLKKRSSTLHEDPLSPPVSDGERADEVKMQDVQSST